MPFPLSLQTSQDVKNVSIPIPTTPVSNFTPPVTPTYRGRGESNPSLPSPIHEATPEQDAAQQKQRTVYTPLRFTDEVEICRDPENRPVEFGRGAWSIVYKARSSLTAPVSELALQTPPTSPRTISRVFAVKAPSRRDARPVLQAEALTLTHLHRFPECERYVVPFHGYHAKSEMLVMSAVPLALSTFIEDQADLMRKKQSTATMFDPVQGPASWRDLACKLISGLAWLHDVAGVIHGDIKSQNLLLRPVTVDESSNVASAFPYEPLYADFSSAVTISLDSTANPDTYCASSTTFTPPFTAPELLFLASLTSKDIPPTQASDVFSLAATLLAAATGDLVLYPGSSSMQRLAMARDGHRILEFTRSGINGVRVPRNGLVEKVVQPAIAKDPAHRIDARQWLLVASSC